MSCQLIVLVAGLAVAVLAEIQVKRISPKIVGGRQIDIKAVPYQVSVQLDNKHVCGGSIIHPSWILTAAHCLRTGTVVNYTIRAGSRIHNFGGVVVKVLKILRHPLFEENKTNNYDAALLELETPLETNKKIRSVPLTETDPKVGELILISGWGSLEEQGPFSKVLYATMVPVVSKDSCKQVYRAIRKIFNSMFCAGYPYGGKDSCRGDSGGPAVFNGNLVGIVSFGKGCGRRNIPGVYVNVTMIKFWVKSQIK